MKLSESQKHDLINSSIEDLEIVLDYLMIARDEKQKRKISVIKSSNEQIIERAYNKLIQIRDS